jgi:hypothetical protein
MAVSFVGYDTIYTGGDQKKSEGVNLLSADRVIARQLDELERISAYERDKHLGKDYFKEIEDFFNLEDDNVNVPSFRPRTRIPQLQTLVLNEATDITDSSPKIYITNEGDRDKDREKYFQANWRQGCYNNRILEGMVWAMLSNLGYLQIGFDPMARRGRGTTWLESRNPKTVYPDPFAKSDKDWSWVGWDDWMYLDEVHRRWPEKGCYVRPHLYMGDVDPVGTVEGTLEFPEASPLSQSGVQDRKIFRDNRVRVRTFYLFDNTREKVKDYAGSATDIAELVHPRFQYKYPDGRWITECEGVILSDGNNWCPQLPDDRLGTFPLIRLLAMPAITNFWGPPPIKLTRSLQNLAERLYTQTFENVVRINNGVIVIKNNTGLDPQGIGWLPGEVLMINQGSDPPQVIAPVALPQHMMTLPAALLSLQKELQGYSQARQGNPGNGNVSADLFDAALWQSQPLTRLRGRLLAESIQRLASIVFYVEGRYKSISDQRFIGIEKDEAAYAKWSPMNSMDKYDAYLDEGSLRVLSGAALKSVVATMAKANMLPTEYVLETFDVPNAKELAEQKMQELELASLSRLKKPR